MKPLGEDSEGGHVCRISFRLREIIMILECGVNIWPFSMQYIESNIEFKLSPTGNLKSLPPLPASQN